MINISCKLSVKIYASIFTIVFFHPVACFASEVFTTFPNSVNPGDKYVFYSHGLIVEGDNPTPENSRWGVYEFPKIKQALSSEEYKLIAYHRPKSTDPEKFSRKLANDVLKLIEQGVAPRNIYLIGFSRGGVITILTPQLLARDDITYIILAGCGANLKKGSGLVLYGHVYSIIEKSDELVGSCLALIEHSEGVQNFTEIAISTGKEHGAFYKPLHEWIDPLKSWIKLD